MTARIRLAAVGVFNARASWTVPPDATSSVSLIQINVPASQTLNATWTANDTTLYSPSWTTNGTYDTFYSLKNTTTSSINGTLTLYNTSGVSVASAALTIPAKGTAATNTVNLAAPRNTGGTAAFSHNGPPGAILAECDTANFTLTPTPYVQPIKFQTVRELR